MPAAMPAAMRAAMVCLLLSIVALGTRAESATTQPLYGANRRTLQTAVSTVDSIDSLTSAVANTTIGRIVLAPGNYVLSAELSITRSVIFEAAVAGSVVLDAHANGGSLRRVLNINPGTSGVVQINGLNITGGNVADFVRAAETCNYPNFSGVITCFALVLAGRWCLSRVRHSQILQLSSLCQHSCLCARSCSKNSLRALMSE